VLSNAKRGARRDTSVNFGACGGRKHAAMSTFPANSDDKLGQVAQSFRCAKDERLPGALSSIPDFPFAGATSHLVDRRSDDQGQPVTTSRPEMAGDGDVKRSQTTVCVPLERRPPRGYLLPPRGLTAGRVVPSRGYVDRGMMPTPMLRRPGYALPSVKTFLVTSVIAATVAGSLVVAILDLVEDSDLPQLMSRAPPLPRAAPATTELRAIMTGSDAERITQAVSVQPIVSLQPTTQSENQPTESRIEVTLPQMVPSSEYEKIFGKTAATPEPPSIAIPELTPISRPEPPAIARLEPMPIATPESAPVARLELTPITTPEPPSIPTSGSTPIATPEPTPESPPINQAPPHIGKIVADRAGFLFADSHVRYLTRAELQKLFADRLHIARNEIFARRGRYFKDDALRTYFSQFPWYQPHAWDVPLGPVEQANVGLIQSIEATAIEAPAAALRGITGPLPAHTKAENGVTFADPSRRYLTPEGLQGLSADQLIIIRNEIFARRGRYFKDDALRTYFSQFPWYQPRAWDVPLSPVEQANVKLVQSFEQTASTPRQASRAP
jgi:hypothetical protein